MRTVLFNYLLYIFANKVKLKSQNNEDPVKSGKNVHLLYFLVLPPEEESAKQLYKLNLN